MKKENVITQKINRQITAPELRVVGENGENLGVLKTEQAIALAEAKGFDLVEIVPTASPPVAKIINFDKFRYEKIKEAKKIKQQSRGKGLKYIQLSPRMAQNDILIKLKQATKFLQQGHKIEVKLRLRGREKANKEWARQKLEEFVVLLADDYKIVSEIKLAGQGFVVQIDKKQ